MDTTEIKNALIKERDKLTDELGEQTVERTSAAKRIAEIRQELKANQRLLNAINGRPRKPKAVEAA